MQKDFKIGLIVGLVLMGVAILWVSTRASLSPQARLERAHKEATASAKPSPTPEIGTPDLSPSRQLALGGVQLSPALPPSDPVTVHMEEITPSLSNESATAIKIPRIHIVQEGETLSMISKTYYGASHQWEKIMAANQDVVKDSSRIRPGMRLIIPE